MIYKTAEANNVVYNNLSILCIYVLTYLLNLSCTGFSPRLKTAFQESEEIIVNMNVQILSRFILTVIFQHT